jgi:predicted nucleic acid-binding protein
MAPAALIDTGVMLAAIESDDRMHSRCLEALRSVTLPLLTTEAVLTEFLHLAARNPLGTERAWKFVRSGVLTLRSISDADLPELYRLMLDYADRPMDFADATLVHLAARESLSLILTVDHDDFETYRIAGRKKFSILPNRSSS